MLILSVCAKRPLAGNWASNKAAEKCSLPLCSTHFYIKIALFSSCAAFENKAIVFRFLNRYRKIQNAANSTVYNQRNRMNAGIMFSGTCVSKGVCFGVALFGAFL